MKTQQASYTVVRTLTESEQPTAVIVEFQPESVVTATFHILV